MFWGEGVKRAGPQRERDGGDSLLATTDSIRQQHRTAFGALKHTRSSYKLVTYYVDGGLSFDASSEVYRGGGLGPCGWKGHGQEKREVHLVLVLFGCWKHRFTLSSGCCRVLSACMFLVFDSHAALSDGK